MQERIRIQFTRDGGALPVTHLDSRGLVFASESSAKPLGFGIGLQPLSPGTVQAMEHVLEAEGWAAFPLRVTRDDPGLIISGEDSIPAGTYNLRFLVSETRIGNEMSTIEIPENGEVRVTLRIASPEFRFGLVDPAAWDGEIRRVCQDQDSRIDGMDPIDWLYQPFPRLARKACLLNLLATARSLPSARPGESLVPLIESIHWADVDRIDVVSKPELLQKLHSMADWKDDGPVHPAHAQTISSIFGGSPADYHVESFRQPVEERSMQVVVATNKTSGRQYAEFDIDLGNPGVDLVGLAIHVGELLDPGRTDHLALYDHVRAGTASDFLYYTLQQGSVQTAGS